MRKLGVLLCLLLAGVWVSIWSDAGSAPSITSVSGTAEDGSTLVITGTGFGTKIVATPYIWDQVENITEYNVLNNGDMALTQAETQGDCSTCPWDRNYHNTYQTGHPTYQQPVYFNSDFAEQRGGSLENYQLDGRGGFTEFFPGDPESVVYIAWYQLIEEWDCGPSANKILRVFGGYYPGDIYATHMDWARHQIDIASDQDHNCISDRAEGNSHVNWSYMNTTEEWELIEFMVDCREDSFICGYGDMWGLQDNYLKHDLENWVFGMDYDPPDLWEVMYVVGFDPSQWGACNDGRQSWLDDIYMDFELNRVVITDSSTYTFGGGDSHVELQPMTSWSDTEISVTLNQGSFALGDTSFIHVFDASNTISGAPDTVIWGSSAYIPDGTISGTVYSGSSIWGVTSSEYLPIGQLKLGIYSAGQAAVVDSTAWSSAGTSTGTLNASGAEVDSTYTLYFRIRPVPSIAGFDTAWTATGVTWTQQVKGTWPGGPYEYTAFSGEPQ